MVAIQVNVQPDLRILRFCALVSLSDRPHQLVFSFFICFFSVLTFWVFIANCFSCEVSRFIPLFYELVAASPVMERQVKLKSWKAQVSALWHPESL